MPISNSQTQSRDIIFIQRDDTNKFYGETHISGSDLVFYTDSDGYINADKSASFYTLFPPPSSSGGGSSAYNGNRAIKRDDPDFFGINVGGTTVTEFLDNFFFPFLPATIALNSGTTYYEIGSTNNISLTATITANDETIFGTGSIRYSAASLTDPAIPPLSFNTTDTGLTVSRTYTAYAQTDNDGSPTVINSSNKVITYVYPYLSGMSTTAGLTGTTFYSAMNKDIIGQSNSVAKSMVGTGVYIYFGMPVEYSPLTSILDQNGFELISSFDYSSSVSVTSVGLASNWTHNYKIYRLTALASPAGTYTFKT